jgi:hypothetical protein
MRGLALCGPAIVAVLGCEAGPREPKAKRSEGPGAASLEELRERAVEALRAGDDKAYLELVASPAFLLEHCAGEPDIGALEEGGAVAARSQQRYEVRTAVATCTDLDWAKATLDRVEGGEPKPSNLTCEPASEEFEDLVSFYRVGKVTWRVKAANDVYRVAGRYVVRDVPKCAPDGG